MGGDGAQAVLLRLGGHALGAGAVAHGLPGLENQQLQQLGNAHKDQAQHHAHKQQRQNGLAYAMFEKRAEHIGNEHEQQKAANAQHRPCADLLGLAHGVESAAVLRGAVLNERIVFHVESPERVE